MQVFSIRELRERSGDLVRELESGQIAIITKQGRPVGVTLPMSDHLLEAGVALALAVELYRSEIVSTSLAAKVAGLSYIEFAEHLSRLRIPLADYGAEQLDRELEVLG